MLATIANVLYVLIAIAMVALILLQRGAGATAGAAFGAGASGTVFGARGSASFLSRSTAVLAALFFLLSLGIGMFLARSGADVRPTDDLGVMSGVTTTEKPAAEAAPRTIEIGDVPAAQPPAADGAAPEATTQPAAAPAGEETKAAAAPAAAAEAGKPAEAKPATPAATAPKKDAPETNGAGGK